MAKELNLTYNASIISIYACKHSCRI